MNTPPSVSVIIPAYNAAQTIRQCVQSVLTQSFKNFEVVVVNDGSADETPNICNSLAQEDARVKVIHQTNKGRTAAREVGLENASAQWVCFIDADDTIPQNSLSDLYSMASAQTDVVFGNGYTLNNEHRKTIPLSDFRHLAVRGEGAIGLPWGSLYRKILLSHYMFDLPKDIYMGEDYIFWLRLIFTTTKPIHIVYNKVYTKGADSTSSSFVWTADYAEKLHALRMQSIPQNVQTQYLKDALSDAIVNLMSVAIFQPKQIWQNSHFYRQLLVDMQKCGHSFTMKQKLFLSIPSLRLRQAYSWFYNRVHRG